MTQVQPRASTLKVGIAIVAVPILTFAGCAYLNDKGKTFHGRGPWEMDALAFFIIAGLLAFYCYQLAFKQTPSFQIHPDRMEHFGWKKPIYFRDVDEVVFEPMQFWMRRPARAYLRLTNGSIQYIPVALMSHGPEEFAKLLREALDRHRSTEPPLS